MPDLNPPVYTSIKQARLTPLEVKHFWLKNSNQGLPDEVKQFQNLEVLHLTAARLDQNPLPNWLEALPHLKTLIIEKSGLKYLPSFSPNCQIL